jgi:HK97 family phage prohead protease
MARSNHRDETPLTPAQAARLRQVSAESTHAAAMFTWKRLGCVGPEPRPVTSIQRATPASHHIYVSAGAEWVRALVDNGGAVTGPATFSVRQPARVGTASPRMRIAMMGGNAKSKDVGSDQLTIKGTALPYGVLSAPDPSGTRTLYKRGAFTRCLNRAPAPDLYALFNFQPDKVLGRVAAGTCIIYEFGDLLMFEAQVPDTTWAADLLVSVNRQDITGSAAACIPVTFHYEYKDGGRIKVVEQAELRCVAVCSWPQFDSGLTVSATVSKPTRLPTALSRADRIRGHGLGIKGQV